MMNISIFAEINWMAVIVAAVAYFLIGALWYAPLFGRKWIKYHQIDVNNPEMKKGVAATFIISFLFMILTCIGLAILIEKMNLVLIISGIKLGLLTGIFFSLAAIIITYLYLKKPIILHFIDGFYHVVAQIVAAVILCVWR